MPEAQQEVGIITENTEGQQIINPESTTVVRANKKKSGKSKNVQVHDEAFNIKLKLSFLELIQILMIYCVKKIQDLDHQQDHSKNQGLSLRRSNSTVDEDKMAGILVKTLQLLVAELEVSRKRLDKAEPLESKKLDYCYQF